MDSQSVDQTTAAAYNRFMNSFVEHRDPRLDLEIHDLKELRGRYLEKAKAAILKRLKKNIDEDAVWCAQAIQFTEAVPILESWHKKLKSELSTAQRKPRVFGELVATLYEFTKDPAYISDMLEAVRTADYGEFEYSVIRLSKMPMTVESMTAVWQRYKKGKIRNGTESWLDHCFSFMQKAIQQPEWEDFRQSVPEDEQRELWELATVTTADRIDRKLRLEEYIKGRDRYDPGDLNKYGEYVKVGGSPVKGITLKSIWKGHTHEITSLAWSPDGRYLASTSKDESIMIWDVSLGESTRLLLREKKTRFTEFQPQEVIWLGNEKLACEYDCHLVRVDDVNGIAVWDLQSETLISPVQPRNKDKDESYLGDFVHSHHSNSLIAGYYEDKEQPIFLIDLATYFRKRVLQEYNGRFEGMAISPDGNMIAAGYQASVYSQDDLHEIVLIDVKTMKIVNRFPGHGAHTNQLCWHPSQPILATASSDDTVGIWDLERNQRLASLKGHRDIVSNVSWSAGGELLASMSSGDHTIQIWDTRTWECILILRELDGSTIAFHPSLPILASSCNEETQEKVFRHDVHSIRIWEFDYEALLDNPPFMNGFM